MKSFFNKIREFIKSNKTARYILCFMVLLAVFSLSVALFSREEKPEEPDDNTAMVTPGESEEPGNTETPDNQPAESVDFSKLTYAAFGDSITFGADYTRGYAQMDNPYSELVAAELGLKNYKNYGVSGATYCQNTLNRDNLTARICTVTQHYDIISVMGGVNDYAVSLPLGSSSDETNSTIYGSLDMAAKYLTSAYPDSFIFFMTPYPCVLSGNECTALNSAGYALTDVVTAVKVVAARYNIPVLDMYNEGNYELEMYNSDSDGIHPSQEFITNYTAPQIVEFIKENYKK